MADSYLGSSGEAAAQGRSYRGWVIGLLGSAALLFVAGLVLAGAEPGVARLWTGAAFVMAMGLALIVGASKTSSA